MKRFSVGGAMLGALAFALPAFAAGYGAAVCSLGGSVIFEKRIIP